MVALETFLRLLCTCRSTDFITDQWIHAQVVNSSIGLIREGNVAISCNQPKKGENLSSIKYRNVYSGYQKPLFKEERGGSGCGRKLDSKCMYSQNLIFNKSLC